MRKIFVYAFLMLTLSLGLTGCAEKKQSNSNTNTNQNNTQNQTINENNIQSETDNNQETTVDISIKDWMESVTINGVKWTEFSEANVTEVFGDLNANKDAQNTYSVSFTDVNGQEYTGTILHEETREDEIVLRYMPDNETDDFAVRFELERNNAGAHILDGIRISRNNVASMEDILVAWGVDKIDAKAFEMATNLQNTGEKEYSFRCTTDYGAARVSVENDLNDEGYREIDVEVDFEDINVPYTIDLMEVYQGDDMENAKYFEIYIDR